VRPSQGLDRQELTIAQLDSYGDSRPQEYRRSPLEPLPAPLARLVPRELAGA
jgi:hypothetical protein